MIAGTDAGIAPIKPPDVIRWAIENFQQIQVDPFVDFSSLDTLVVLVPKENRAQTP